MNADPARPLGIVILGSTGSIGRQALEVIRAHQPQVRVVGLAAARNATLLYEQIRDFQPTYYALTAPRETEGVARAGALRCTLEELAALPEADVVLVATVGRAGLAPTLAALRAGKRVALANKEVLVMAGAIITREAEAAGAVLVPVDSEHSAIWQCLRGEHGEGGGARVARLLLTASGGAFRDAPAERLATVTPQEALRHPTWQMGPKVTVDSATLMNKGFEVIEARWLFGIPYERIEVLLHRESIVHSLVEFVDGSVKAQLSVPDMRLPLQYALSYPDRWPGVEFPRLDLARLGTLSFGPVEPGRYPCLDLALEAGRRGGTYPAVLSAADEAAVEAFLQGRIGFLDIPDLVGATLAVHQGSPQPSLEAILAADAWARETVEKRIPTRHAQR
ncbi:MAG: 1-deoxy-D-xylulose-5-phosphate reductoisomerase [Chloroflexi bacterium]|nr:1-deoxy-D-xylulose-5-phosphate reductoisomerase [Chloroflexota bacterium]